MVKPDCSIVVFKLLLKEAIVWRQLSHEHILPFLGICESLLGMLDSMVLVSPWMEAGDLSEFSKASRNIEYDGVDFVSQSSTNAVLFSISCIQILQIARGLEYLHSQEPQVIHGDLRGVNILPQKSATSY